MTWDERRARLLLPAAALIVLVLAGLAVWLALRESADGSSPPPDASSLGDLERSLLEGFDEVAITVNPGDGAASLVWCLLAAITAEQRARGLMEVTDLRGYAGMVFVYDQDVDNAFYMRNTPTPLSIAWIAADGNVVTIKDMEPCEDRASCPRYPSDGTYRYAIEVFQGGLDDLGITETATVTVGGRCEPR